MRSLLRRGGSHGGEITRNPSVAEGNERGEGLLALPFPSMARRSITGAFLRSRTSLMRNSSYDGTLSTNTRGRAPTQSQAAPPGQLSGPPSAEGARVSPTRGAPAGAADPADRFPRTSGVISDQSPRTSCAISDQSPRTSRVISEREIGEEEEAEVEGAEGAEGGKGEAAEAGRRGRRRWGRSAAEARACACRWTYATASPPPSVCASRS